MADSSEFRKYNNGPSWWDVEREIEELRREFDCAITVTVIPFRAGRANTLCWQVNAQRHPKSNPSHPPTMVAGYQYGGNDGAKTMPMAFYMALLRLRNRLEDARETAAKQSSF